MIRNYLTYLFAVIFLFNLMAPTINSMYSLVIGCPEKELVLDIIDSEKEENQGNEKETNDHKEKEKFEDEKLRQLNDKFSLLYLKNSIKALCFQASYAYQNITRAVPTPPPEFPRS
ncbi:MAG: hypothetical protein RIG77_26860 [Cyclobacteriaceae bacterium]